MQKLMIWAHTHKEQLREGVKLAVLVVVALAAMKGLVLLGLVFQFLLPLSTIAAAILAIVQISFMIVAGVLAAIVICAVIGLATSAAWRSLKRIIG